MSDLTHQDVHEHDVAPGDEESHSIGARVLGYVLGLGLALLLTATSFFIAGTSLVASSLLMSVWNGPQQRILGVLGSEIVFGVGILLIGLRPAS